MLLRTSSAPILGSLLHTTTTTTPFSDSPTTHHHHHPFTCHFSDSTDHLPSSSVRRSRSDGNLHALLSDHPNDPHNHHHPSPRSSSRLPTPILETVPSFSVYNTTDLKEVEEDTNDIDELPATTVTGFSFEKQNARMATSPLFLARGLGIDRIGSGLMNAGGGGDGGGGDRCYGGGDQSDIEGYYKRMIDENPSNVVFLRNYAQFLYQRRETYRELKSTILVQFFWTPAMERSCHSMLNWYGSCTATRNVRLDILNVQSKLLLRTAMFLHRMLDFYGKQRMRIVWESLEMGNYMTALDPFNMEL